MKKPLKWLCVAAVSMLMMGCTLFPEQPKFNPTVDTSHATNIGHGKVVALQVVDQRASQQIGRRSSGIGPMARITPGNNPAQAIYKAVSSGLSAHGFTPVDYATHRNEPVSLTIILQKLSYRMKAPIGYDRIIVHSKLGANAMHNRLRYQQTYSVRQQHNYVMMLPTADQESLNQVVSTSIDKLFADQKLMNFLAR
jgi:uncharacterized lipoprotein YajG